MQGIPAMQWGVQPMLLAPQLQEDSRAVDKQPGETRKEQTMEVETLNLTQGSFNCDVYMWLQEAASGTKPSTAHRATAAEVLKESAVQQCHLPVTSSMIPSWHATPSPPQIAAAAVTATYLQHPAAQHSPQTVMSLSSFACTPQQQHPTVMYSSGSATSAEHCSDRTVEHLRSNYWTPSSTTSAAAGDLQLSLQQHSPQSRLSSPCCAGMPQQLSPALLHSTGMTCSTSQMETNNRHMSHLTRSYTPQLLLLPSAAAAAAAAADAVLAAAALPHKAQLRTAASTPPLTSADTAAQAIYSDLPEDLSQLEPTAPGTRDFAVTGLRPLIAAAAGYRQELPGILCKQRCTPVSSSSDLIMAASPTAPQAATAANDACRTAFPAGMCREDANLPVSSSAIWGITPGHSLLDAPARTPPEAAAKAADAAAFNSTGAGGKLHSSSAGTPGVGITSSGSNSTKQAKHSSSGAVKRSASPSMLSDLPAGDQGDAKLPVTAAAAAMGAKRKQANMLCQRRVRQRQWEEAQDLKSQVGSLTAHNTLLQSKLDCQQADFTDLLDSLAAVTDKWRLTVAANAELHRENAEIRQTISQLQQLLRQNSPPQQQCIYPQPQHWHEQQLQEQWTGWLHDHGREQPYLQ